MDGLVLTLEENGGFHYEHWMDISRTPVYSNNGTYRINRGVLRLFPNHSTINNGHHETEMETEYYPVHWGKRHYLINSDDMVQFCNSVNDATQYNQDLSRSDFIRSGEEELPHESLMPDVPAEWRPYLLPSVVRGQVTRIIDDKTGAIDIGSTSGLQPGMKLREENTHSDVEVVTCSPKSAVVRLLEPNEHSKTWFTVGTQVVSREGSRR
ncbi:MAG: hypothetical protein ABIY70_12960 [Capsulimonas sp.]|uniref:hypothetical protein n=1 Tax=Capsulimonas sp. TaxID=2494211 RepID=UPI003265D388